MRTFRLTITIALLILTACGDKKSGSLGANNTSNNATNNSTTSGSNNQTTNNQTNNQTTNNQTNNQTTNNQTNNQTMGPVPLDEFVDAFHQVLCEVAWECPNRLNAEFSIAVFGRFATLAACEAADPVYVNQTFGIAQLVSAAQAGRIDYDPQLARDCLEAFKAALCDEDAVDLQLPAECSAALGGAVQLGESCTVDIECGAGNRCARASMSMTCYGTCEQAVDVCGTEVCLPQEFCEAGACEPRRPDGDGCMNTEQCMEGSGCVAGTCTPYNSIAEGGSCSGGDYCADGNVCAGGECQPLTFAGLNADCGMLAAGLVYCEAGLACIPTGVVLGTCQPHLVEGASCQGTFTCAAGLYCDTTCLPTLADGEVCTNNLECVSGDCDTTCQPLTICEIP